MAEFRVRVSMAAQIATQEKKLPVERKSGRERGDIGGLGRERGDIGGLGRERGDIGGLGRERSGEVGEDTGMLAVGGPMLGRCPRQPPYGYVYGYVYPPAYPVGYAGSHRLGRWNGGVYSCESAPGGYGRVPGVPVDESSGRGGGRRNGGGAGNSRAEGRYGEGGVGSGLGVHRFPPPMVPTAETIKELVGEELFGRVAAIRRGHGGGCVVEVAKSDGKTLARMGQLLYGVMVNNGKISIVPCSRNRHRGRSENGAPDGRRRLGNDYTSIVYPDLDGDGEGGQGARVPRGGPAVANKLYVGNLPANIGHSELWMFLTWGCQDIIVELQLRRGHAIVLTTGTKASGEIIVNNNGRSLNGHELVVRFDRTLDFPSSWPAAPA